VTLVRADNASLVRIADNGPGVPERARERLFQPFAGSGRPDGAGLGLAIARELAHGHGGDLTLVETSDKGSTFEVRLPGAPPPARARRSANSAA
jgi:signal transduction histidine kinase